MKHRKRDPGSGVSSSKSNISRAMRGRIPKIANFLAIQNQLQKASTFRIASNPQLRPQLQMPQNNRKDRRIEIAAALLIMVSKVHLSIQQSHHHLNDPGERVMLRTTSPHPNPLLKRCNTLQTNSRPRSISLQEKKFLHPLRSTRSTTLDFDTPTLVRSMTVLEAEGHDLDERIIGN